MSDRAKQVWGYIIAIPIILAAAVSLILLLLRLQGAARTWTLAGFVAIGLATLLFYLLRNARGNKQVATLLDLLHKQADVKAFIQASEQAVTAAKHNKALKSTLLLNLAIGYEADGNFEEAIQTMARINVLSADALSKAMYYNNLAGFYIESGRVEEALITYKNGQHFCEKAKKQIPNAYLLFTRGLLYFGQEQYQEAADTFARIHTDEFDDRHTTAKLQLYRARTLAKSGKAQEARALYAKIVQRKTYPYLIECARRESEACNA